MLLKAYLFIIASTDHDVSILARKNLWRTSRTANWIAKEFTHLVRHDGWMRCSVSRTLFAGNQVVGADIRKSGNL